MTISPPSRFEGCYGLKHSEIERQVEEDQRRLRRVDARLKQIELEGKMSPYEIIVKQVESVRAATVRDIVANYSSVGSLFNEVYSTLSKYHLAPSGPAIAIYYDEEYRESDVDVEMVAPVASGEIPTDERVQIRTVKGYASVASLVRRGLYDDFAPEYQALIAWIRVNDYRICGPNREIYLRGPGEEIVPEKYLTEIQFPIEKL